MKGVGLLRKLQHTSIFLTTFKPTISKSFLRPQLDYGDAIYVQPSNITFSSKIKSVQQNVVLAITSSLFRGKFHGKFGQ